MGVMLAAFVWWNARGLANKAEELKDMLRDRGAIYCGVSESHTHNDSAVLSDKRWKWEGGKETANDGELVHSWGYGSLH